MLAEDKDLTARGSDQSKYDLQESAFPGTIGPQNAHIFAALDLQINFFQRRQAVIANGKTSDFYRDFIHLTLLSPLFSNNAIISFAVSAFVADSRPPDLNPIGPISQ
jgi:hypothetical protein